MPEYYVQTLYAVLTVLALSVGTVRIVTENADKWPCTKMQIKPFTCVYCMTWWTAAVITIFIFPKQPYLMIPVVQILAFILYQKAL